MKPLELRCWFMAVLTGIWILAWTLGTVNRNVFTLCRSMPIKVTVTHPPTVYAGLPPVAGLERPRR